MAKRRTKRAASRAMRHQGETTKPKGKSPYARKKAWLKANGSPFGFTIPDPKPWR